MDKTQSDRKRTIVGGRPRGHSLGRGGIPRGIEVLIKKASLDPAFCRLLLEQRAAAAREIQLELTPAERTILDSVPEAQLRTMIDHTKVPDAQRRAFLGTLGAAMLSAIVAGCTPPTDEVAPITGIRPEDGTETRVVEVEKGIRPDFVTRTPTPEDTPTSAPEDTPTPPPAVTGIRPEQGETPSTPVVRGIRPDRP